MDRELAFSRSGQLMNCVRSPKLALSDHADGLASFLFHLNLSVSSLKRDIKSNHGSALVDEQCECLN